MSVVGAFGQSQSKNNTVTKETIKMEKMHEIYFAGGCFWGTEHFMKQIKGVISTEVGYANATVEAPTYQQVCSGNTGAAEAVKVVFDPKEVELCLLINLFFKTIDPTTLNQQGNDVGTQYRTGIYYTDKSDLKLLKTVMGRLATDYSKPLVVEVLPLLNFYTAETYHQDYLQSNPKGYCHIDPALFKVAREANVKPVYSKLDDDVLRAHLSDQQYAVTQKNATEPAFENAYWDEYRKGIYVDVTNGEPLFLSTDKFQSDCGWPSFSKPINCYALEEKVDTTHGMQRLEIRSKTGDSHLGHLFTDGPADKGGLRYCINSASLRFIPVEKMEKAGYGNYIYLIK